jgi:hypothetical protein
MDKLPDSRTQNAPLCLILYGSGSLALAVVSSRWEKFQFLPFSRKDEYFTAQCYLRMIGRTLSQTDGEDLSLAMLILMYLLVTILRSIRADFATEIWIGLGEPAAPQTFTTSEIFVAVGVIVINGGMVLVHDNRRAFTISLLTCLAGFTLIAAALIGRPAAQRRRSRRRWKRLTRCRIESSASPVPVCWGSRPVQCLTIAVPQRSSFVTCTSNVERSPKTSARLIA